MDRIGLDVRRLSTAERIAAALRDRIVAGEIEPGTTLRDQELSARANVSRNTMREALQLLAHEGLLSHELHRGMVVKNLSVEDVRDIYRLRAVVEGAAIRCQASREAVVGLGESVRAFAEAAAAGDGYALVQAEADFHSGLVGFLGSPRLSGLHRGVMNELRLALSTVDRVYGDLDRQVGEHRRLYELVVAGERDAAAEALAEHLRQAEEKVLAFVRERNTTTEVG
jgi:DNA-binding GntR family transcriptional regulator